jgi:hypothetical protein
MPDQILIDESSEDERGGVPAPELECRYLNGIGLARDE